MEQETKKKSKVLSLVAKTARAAGEHSAKQLCFIWYHQPKIPASMKRKNIED